MLELRANCEACGKELLPNSTEAMICTFECTFCQDCVEQVLQNVCPNCGGGFERRPVRPKEKLVNNPAQTHKTPKTYNQENHARYLEKYKNILPKDR